MSFLEEDRHLYEGLTRYNYFPNQKDSVGEIPPCFSSRQFTPEIVELLVNTVETKLRKKLGYDQVEYLATRHDNVPRSLSLIHPKPYALLSKVIHDNWSELEKITDNDNSMIKPEMHMDGRIMIMNYEDVTDKSRRGLNDSFGKRFRVQTDIASCFHSIYTHSIPWAAIGFDVAKANLTENKQGDSHWSDNLDKYLRKSKRNETQGIAIGPATSSIVAEHILGAVDKVLVEKGFGFRRHIDDYSCYCDTYEDAQQFIQLLGTELRAYKLNINLHKTKIVELPAPLSDDWVSTLAGALPNSFIDENYNRRKLIESEIVHYLDSAVRLNNNTPDGSVIKYAVSSIIHNISEYCVESILDYILNLSWHYPVLLPYLDNLFSVETITTDNYSDQLNLILIENARNGRSDGMAWPLYFLKKYSLPISDEAALKTIESRDCLSILVLYSSNRMCEEIIQFSNERSVENLYEKDKYWLLLYQLYIDGKIEVPYDDGCFEILKEHGVNFMPEDAQLSYAEQYCSYYRSPFRQVDDELLSYKDWLKSRE